MADIPKSLKEELFEQYLELSEVILNYSKSQTAVVKRIKLLERKIQIERIVRAPFEPTRRVFKRWLAELELLKQEFHDIAEVLEAEKEVSDALFAKALAAES